MSLILLLVLLAFSCFASAHRFLGSRLPKSVHGGAQTKLPYHTAWFTQMYCLVGFLAILTRALLCSQDHFNYQAPVGNQYTFKQRVLYNLDYWKSSNASQCPGPILFYTGNESPVTDYWNNSGFIIDVLAPKYGAAIYFVEHRYFGKTMPYGKQSFDKPNIGYLSTEQALADYALFLEQLKQSMPYDCPVFSFGGSYGGMLTTFFRTKYPWLVMGGLAASAPLAFPGTPQYNPFAFMDTCESTWYKADSRCPSAIGTGLRTLAQMAQTTSGRADLSRKFKLCTPVTTYDEAIELSYFFQGALVDMTMLDYPYAANYGVAFPAWPVNTTCSDILQQSDIIEGMSDGLQNFYNTTGTRPCLDMATDVPDWGTGDGWPYISCSGMTFITAQRGMWWPHTSPNISDFVNSCQKQFRITARPDYAATTFGGEALASASNIIFSSGMLDPWSTSSIETSLSASLPAIVIPEAAHHLDLRGPHPNDPVYVQQARDQEAQYITKWFNEWFSVHNTVKKSSYVGDWSLEKDMAHAMQFE